MKTANKMMLGVLLIAFLVTFGIAQQNEKTIPEKGTPLTGLVKKSDGHWSPYEAPVYPDGTPVHVIKAGDSLWALAQQYLSTPYLWPQIWENNGYIVNPHWIYPGDPILLEEPKLVDKPEIEDFVEEEPVEEKPVLDNLKTFPHSSATRKPVTFKTSVIDLYYSTETELYGSGLLYQRPIQTDLFITGAEEEKSEENFGLGRIVYLNKGMNQNVFPGARFEIIRSEFNISNPVTGNFVGHYYRQMGTLKVLIAHDDKAIAEIDFCVDPVYIGDGLIPFVEKERVPKDPEHKFQRFVEDNGRPTGNVVFIKDGMTITSEGGVVFIDIGRNANLVPGQFCTAYSVLGDVQRNSDMSTHFSTESIKGQEERGLQADSRKALETRSLPRVIVGELVILDVYENAAKAKVVYSRQTIELGHYVQVQ